MKYWWIVLMAALIMSCSLKQERQKAMSKNQQVLPEQTADSVDVIYSEGGVIKVTLKAPKLIMVDNPQEQLNEFPEGLTMSFFDDNGEKNADLTADYGFDDVRKQERYVKGNVKIVNVDGIVYTTEELYIDEPEDSVYNNNKYVKITKPDGSVLEGDGFVADTRLEKIRIKGARGVVNVKENEVNLID